MYVRINDLPIDRERIYANFAFFSSCYRYLIDAFYIPTVSCQVYLLAKLIGLGGSHDLSIFEYSKRDVHRTYTKFVCHLSNRIYDTIIVYT